MDIERIASADWQSMATFPPLTDEEPFEAMHPYLGVMPCSVALPGADCEGDATDGLLPSFDGKRSGLPRRPNHIHEMAYATPISAELEPRVDPEKDARHRRIVMPDEPKDADRFADYPPAEAPAESF